MRKLDSLFIHCNASKAVYQDLSKNYSAIEPPIWAALLANGVRNEGHSTSILDCEALHLTTEQSVDKIIEINPKIAIFVVYGQQPSASTQNMIGASLVINLLKDKSPGIKIVIIGGHVSALPHETINELPVDVVIKGEGLCTIVKLIEDGVPDKKLVIEETMIPQEELANQLPGMAWDLLPMDRYRTSNWHGWSNNNERQPFASLYTSLGCPFSCTFCMINSPFSKKTIRYWNPEFTIKEFDKIAEMGIRNVKIADEMFVLLEDHFLKLCKLIKERKYDFNIWAYSRIDTVKDRHLEHLRDAGVKWLALGIESGNTVVRKDVVKGKYKDVDIRDIISKIQSYDINVIGNFIFGLPEDNFKTMQETLDLSLDLKCEMVNFYSAMAYPGSKLYEIAKKENWVLPDSWVGYSQHAYETRPLDTKYIKGGEVLKFRDQAMGIYFTDPSYLSFMKNKFGEKTVQDISNMLSIKLKRQYVK